MGDLQAFKVLKGRRRVIAAAVVSLALIVYVDWLTGPNVAVTIFYLVPVCVLTWFCGKWVGYFSAALYALMRIALDAQGPLAYWNAIMRFVTFGVVVWLVYLCKNLMAEIDKLVQEKTAALRREVEMRAAAEESIRQLASQLSMAEDAQRRRFGQELHDSFGQSLTLLKLRLESLAKRLASRTGEAEDLEESVELLKSLIGQTRTMTFELYPSMLDQLGLAATLRQYAEQLSAQVGASISVVDGGEEVGLAEGTASFLFRAVKELVTNALKHGRADEIVVQVRHTPGHVRVVVSDDGPGFDGEKPPQGGLGLPWIRERLRALGGSLAIESEAGQGARVIMDLPAGVAGAAKQRSVADGEPVVG